MTPGFVPAGFYPPRYWAPGFWADKRVVKPPALIPGYWAQRSFPRGMFPRDFWPERGDGIVIPTDPSSSGVGVRVGPTLGWETRDYREQARAEDEMILAILTIFLEKVNT